MTHVVFCPKLVIFSWIIHSLLKFRLKRIACDVYVFNVTLNDAFLNHGSRRVICVHRYYFDPNGEWRRGFNVSLKYVSFGFILWSVFHISPVLSISVFLTSQHGHGSRQTRGTAVHQRSGRQRKQRCARLLPHVRVRALRGHGGHPRPDRTLRFHLLCPCVFPAVLAPDSQSRSPVEQVLQISTSAVYRGPRGRPLYIRAVLDFPLRNGACVLKGLGQYRSRVDVTLERC